MRFRKHQGMSKRKSAVLVLLLVVALLGTASMVYLVVYPVGAWIKFRAADDLYEPLMLWKWDARIFLAVVGVTLLFMGLTYVLRIGDLRRGGGGGIAKRLGGERIERDTMEFKERRLLNIVDEMALASGMAPPPVYVLPERGINAFAAGYTANDATVAVTRGALDEFSRDEMQAVIGHEFSHIATGDVKLSTRIIATVSAIMTVGVVGKGLVEMIGNGVKGVRVRSSSSSRGGGLLLIAVIAGLCLWAIGMIGAGIGRVIQAAVSRQREFLADATAVEFTRNPQALVGALNRIGSNRLQGRLLDPYASEYAHMFFMPCDRMFLDMVATHPPLPERIRRLGGQVEHVEPRTPQPDPKTVEVSKPSLVDPMIANPVLTATAGAVLGSVARSGKPTAKSLRQAKKMIDGFPVALIKHTRRPESARAVIYSLLMKNTTNMDVRASQWRHLEQAEPGARDRIYAVHRADLERVSPRRYLPLIDLCVPALRTSSPEVCRAFLDALRWLIEADGKTTITEWAILRMMECQLRVALGEDAAPAAVQYDTIEPLEEQAGALLSLFAWAGGMDETTTGQAWCDGMKLLGFRSRLMPVVGRSIHRSLDEAINAFQLADRAVCLQLLAAIAGVIVVDNEVSLRQEMALRAIADCLDCPIPPIAVD